MKTSLLLTISGIHGLLLGILLFFLPAMTLTSYGDYTLNQLHFDLSRHLGIITLVLGLVLLFHRNSSNAQLVKTLLLTIGVLNVLGAVFDLKAIAPDTKVDALVEIGVRLVLGVVQCWGGWKVK